MIDRHSENIYMADEVYDKILDNLQEINYSGMISYSRYNEPLADGIFFKRLKQARGKLPKALLHTNTNGDYLNLEMVRELYEAGLRSLNIQVYMKENEHYSDEIATQKLMERIEELNLPYQFIRSQSKNRLEYKLFYRDFDIRIYIRNFFKNGVDRGGMLDFMRDNYERVSPCLIPFQHFYIDYNGCVVPCCNMRSDYKEHQKFIAGDLTNPDSNIFNIFSSLNLISLRKALIGFNQKSVPCNFCRFMEIPANNKNIELAEKLSIHV